MKSIPRVIAAAALIAVAGCVPQFMDQKPQQTPIAYGPATEHQVEQALQHYSGLIASMDAPAIADMYTPDGVWERQSGALQGREAIRQAVSSAAARILTNEMTTTYMSYNGPAVVQTGDFKQSARLPDGKVVSAAGKFEATWVRGPNGEWWILRMVTRPAK